MEWSDKVIEPEDWKPLRICLDEKAVDYFIDWRNDLFERAFDLPYELKGFIPNAVSHALRLTGVVCMNCFAAGTSPLPILKLADIQNGIRATMFLHAAGRLCHPGTLLKQTGHSI
jgi:hypothetical protein